jgi:hypothetical protein
LEGRRWQEGVGDLEEQERSSFKKSQMNDSRCAWKEESKIEKSNPSECEQAEQEQQRPYQKLRE